MNSIGLVSVVMPVFNREALIAESINCVLNQTYTNLELVICDDCSTDSTVEVIKDTIGDDPRVKLIQHEVNQGAAETRITAANNATSSWIAFIDSDDLWAPDKLEKQVKLLSDTGADAVYSASAFIEENGTPVDYIFHVPTTISYKELLKQNVMSNSSVIVRKDLFLKYGQANADVHEDFKCWLSILKNGSKVVGIDEALMTFRLTVKSITTNKKKSSVMTWNTYKDMGLNIFQRIYYMSNYTVRSLIKYRNIP